MPEDLKLLQIGSSQLPPPFRGLHSPCLLFPEIVYSQTASAIWSREPKRRSDWGQNFGTPKNRKLPPFDIGVGGTWHTRQLFPFGLWWTQHACPSQSVKPREKTLQRQTQLVSVCVWCGSQPGNFFFSPVISNNDFVYFLLLLLLL